MFLCGVFVPADTLPGVLRTFAEWKPVTTFVESLRSRFGDSHNVAAASDPWSLQHAIAYTLIACAAIVAVCGPVGDSLVSSVDRGVTEAPRMWTQEPGTDGRAYIPTRDAIPNAVAAADGDAENIAGQGLAGSACCWLAQEADRAREWGSLPIPSRARQP